jgi:hypothetical protein
MLQPAQTPDSAWVERRPAWCQLKLSVASLTSRISIPHAVHHGKSLQSNLERL